MERTLVILKPDCVQRRLVGRILARIEDKGLRIVAMKMLKMDRALADRIRPRFSSRELRKFHETVSTILNRHAPSDALFGF